ncbi:hypothetical protein SH528x_002129 [Novipirellula sp. SH528]|uniref:hypothetical protein n=1 Tax=Novipirellula sp. SH528 TaxID=3454466 RepID=UPI003FA12F05
MNPYEPPTSHDEDPAASNLVRYIAASLVVALLATFAFVWLTPQRDDEPQGKYLPSPYYLEDDFAAEDSEP